MLFPFRVDIVRDWGARAGRPSGIYEIRWEMIVLARAWFENFKKSPNGPSGVLYLIIAFTFLSPRMVAFLPTRKSVDFHLRILVAYRPFQLQPPAAFPGAPRRQLFRVGCLLSLTASLFPRFASWLVNHTIESRVAVGIWE